MTKQNKIRLCREFPECTSLNLITHSVVNESSIGDTVEYVFKYYSILLKFQTSLDADMFSEHLSLLKNTSAKKVTEHNRKYKATFYKTEGPKVVRIDGFAKNSKISIYCCCIFKKIDTPYIKLKLVSNDVCVPEHLNALLSEIININ